MDGSQPAKELVAPIQDGLFGSQWSPDGNQLLYVSSQGDSSSSAVFYNLWSVSRDGEEHTQLTSDINVYSIPRWSTDGEWILFAGSILYEEPEPLADLWLLSRSGQELKRLTSGAENENEPSWSADSSRVYYLKDQTEVWALSLVDGKRTLITSASIDFIEVPSIRKEW